MSNRHEYPQVNATGEVSNAAGSLDLVSNPGSVTYLYLDRLNISIFQAAAGGGGIVRIQDTDGGHVWTVNADGVKDVSLSWGDEGLKLGPNVGLQAIVANAQGEQASASVSVAGHLAFR